MKYIIKLIENIVKSIISKDSTKFKYNYEIFFPLKKEWFEINIKYLNNIKNDRPDILKSLIYYKGNGYYMLNKILINGKLPFILIYDSYDAQNLKANKTKFNTPVIYIFPDDIEKIKLYERNKIINHIKNIDYVFTKKEFKLSDCILFRGIHSSSYSKNTSNNDYAIFEKLISSSTTNIQFNSEEILFKNYSSFSLNPLVSINFSGTYNKNSVSYILILNIKKEHNVPGIFLSNIFFNINTPYKYNNIKGDEMEILISRNLKIKILKIKIIENKINKDTSFSYKSLKEIYKEDNKKENLVNKKKIIKIIFAESLPFEYPGELNLDGYKYLCV
jgi:hypothetical protein